MPSERTPDEWHRLLHSDDPAERFLAVVAMALDVPKDIEPIRFLINISAATISLARRDFYEMLAEQKHRVH